jgi:hypothetical protein
MDFDTLCQHIGMMSQSLLWQFIPLRLPILPWMFMVLPQTKVTKSERILSMTYADLAGGL